MNPIVNVISENCTLCYACVRACPVNAIKISPDDESANIIDERCISCGNCYTACPHGAIVYQDSITDVNRWITAGENVVAIVDPSIPGEFDDITDYRKFVSMIRVLGFSKVIEGAFAVDILAEHYAELVNNFKGKYYLFTSCPVVAAYMERYAPEMIENLAPLISPVHLSSRMARQWFGKECRTVYIGSCIAHKGDKLSLDDGDSIDSVLTYEELRRMFSEKNISESHLEFSEFDGPSASKGGLFAISSGILDAANIESNTLSGSMYTSEGPDNFVPAMREFVNNIDLIHHNFNIFFCHGCIMGPGMTRRGNKFQKHTLVIDYLRKRMIEFDEESWEVNKKEYRNLPTLRSFMPNDQRMPEPSEQRIQEIMDMLEMDSSNDKGCNNCGYQNCREFAVAVANGLANSNMCLTYNIRHKVNYIKSLNQTNEKLMRTQAALKESEEKARLEQQKAKESLDRTTAMLQRLPSGIILADENMRIILANDTFIDMLGDELKSINDVIPGLIGAELKSLLPAAFFNLFSYVLSNDSNVLDKDIMLNEKLFSVSVFSVSKHKVVGAVIRDLYLPEVQKEEIVRRVTDVIDENLSMVQQIAYLLGEGASKTERMLNTIIDSYQKNRPDGK